VSAYDFAEGGGGPGAEARKQKAIEACAIRDAAAKELMRRGFVDTWVAEINQARSIHAVMDEATEKTVVSGYEVFVVRDWPRVKAKCEDTFNLARRSLLEWRSLNLKRWAALKPRSRFEVLTIACSALCEPNPADALVALCGMPAKDAALEAARTFKAAQE